VDPVLQFSGVRKSYSGQVAIEKLDLDVATGRTMVLIGPSGCGKSTLLRLVTGLVEADAGRIRVNGQTLAADNISALRRRLGYVIQEGGLFPHLTARDNLSLLARYQRWPGSRIDGRVAELADLVRLPKSILSRYPGEISGGQRQRVALMRALFSDPDLLLLDEPLGALDPMVRYELQCELKHLFERLHKTVLLVTHDMAEAAWFADQIVLMNAGRIVQQGSAEDLVFHPAQSFVREFVRAQRQHMGGVA